MNQANVISVNPGIKTIGELRVNEHVARKISHAIANTAPQNSITFKSVIDFMTGINSRITGHLSMKIMMLRVVCGTLLLGMVLIPMSSANIYDLDFSVTEVVGIIAGFSIIFGAFMRVVCFGCASFLSYNLYIHVLNSGLELSGLAEIGMLLIFTIMGPGMYCIDQLLRRGIYSIIRKRAKRAKAKLNESSFEYNAYEMLDRRIS